MAKKKKIDTSVSENENNDETIEDDDTQPEKPPKKTAKKKKKVKQDTDEGDDSSDKISTLEKLLKAKDEEHKKDREEFAEFKNKLKNVFGEKEEKKDDPNSDLKKYFDEQFKALNERIDAREHEDALSSISDSLGLQTDEQREFLEFKLAKAQDSKGSDLTHKEVEKIGNDVRASFGLDKKKDKKTAKTEESDETQDLGASSVNEMQVPAVDIGDATSITQKQFNDMNLLEKSEFYKANPQLYKKYSEKNLEGEMNLQKSKFTF